MPYSLRFLAVLLVLTTASAAASLQVQHMQSQRRSRDVAVALTGGSPDRGREAIRRYGCGGCHAIDGVSGATGKVAPALKSLSKQAELAGPLTNDVPSMIGWIQHPQTIEPGVGMPELGVTDSDARDIAGYLYSL